jgi:hypothetical protein
MAGPSHHYLPAGFIGRFSADTSGSSRERSLFVLEAGQNSPAITLAERIGCENDLYTLYGAHNNQAPDAVDNVWSQYEQKLGPALDELSRPGQKTISANTWLRVLVPFVTGLFVRGAEFGKRYESRPVLKSLYDDKKVFGTPELRSDNTNNSRVIEFQRLLAPVMSARWVVMHTKGEHPVITNELGFTVFQPPYGSDPGIAIPIGPNTILGIIRTWPTHGRLIMQDGGTGQWRTLIEHRTLTENDQKNFNEAMADISDGFIAGPTAESLEPHKEALARTKLKAEIVEAFWPNPLIRVAHEFEWYRAVTAISQKSGNLNQAALQNRDWSVIGKDWAPMVILPLNLKDFPSGMILQKDKIGLSMTEVPGFTDGAKNSPYVITGKPKDTQTTGTDT